MHICHHSVETIVARHRAHAERDIALPLARQVVVDYVSKRMHISCDFFHFLGGASNGRYKIPKGVKIDDFRPKSPFISETARDCIIGPWFLWITNRKSLVLPNDPCRFQRP